MLSRNSTIRYHVIIAVLAITGILFIAGLYNIKIETDVVKSLPTGDPVIADALYILKHSPVQDRIVIDIGINSDNSQNLNDLVTAAALVEKRLNDSGLFKQTGMEHFQKLIPELITHVVKNLPILFSEKELEQYIAPLIDQKSIKKTMEENLLKLSNIEGIGQGEFIIHDPLSFRNIVMKRLRGLAPAKDAHVHKGRIISSDGRHLLIPASPAGSGTDTEISVNITDLINGIRNELDNTYKNKFTITPVGAYRAALDNELIARRDTERAITLATIGIALMLILSFPRPLIGLIALLPAIFGTMTALFIYSLFNDSISLLTIGFGGAIISITVDHGIAYLLFMDRPCPTSGRDAARNVRAVGLFATLTTVGAFSLLFISGFPILTQIGRFAALGISLSFIFVHTVFPMTFIGLSPAGRKGPMPLSSLGSAISSPDNKFKTLLPVILFCVMVFFARPEFHVDLSSMNTVSSDTLQAENTISDIWGNIFSKVYILTVGATARGLQDKSDIIELMIEADIEKGILSSAFVPSMIFPGEQSTLRNIEAWKKFWNKKRVSTIKSAISKASAEIGFTPDAFNPFYRMVELKDPQNPVEIPEHFFPLLDIKKSKINSRLNVFSILTPGENYKGEELYSRYSRNETAKIFDAELFSNRLGALLSSTFIKMAITIGVIIIILLFILFLSIKLTLVSLMPIAFAMICSLGTIKLLGRPLDIPALMLSIIIFGMGIDYSLYFVSSYQRFRNGSRSSIEIIQTAVLLAGTSTLIGFGVLSFSEHSLLRSVGLTAVIGIGYSLIGSYTILPPLLKFIYRQRDPIYQKVTPGTPEHRKRTLQHYILMEPYPRLFARFKTLFDPMFQSLNEFVLSPRVILDIGCGYGVPAVWLLELYPQSRVIGIDPDTERTRIAAGAVGTRGRIITGKAQELPVINDKPDTILMLDIIHLLSDEELHSTLQAIDRIIQPGGITIIRATVPSEKKFPWERLLENLRLKIKNKKPAYRTADQLKNFIKMSGLKIILIKPCSKNREETWFIAGKPAPER